MSIRDEFDLPVVWYKGIAYLGHSKMWLYYPVNTTKCHSLEIELRNITPTCKKQVISYSS